MEKFTLINHCLMHNIVMHPMHNIVTMLYNVMHRNTTTEADYFVFIAHITNKSQKHTK